MRLLPGGIALLAIVFAALTPASVFADAATENRLVALLNAEREAAGLRPLVAEPALHELAQTWASTQAASQRLDHRSLDDQATWVEARVTPSWERIAENVAYGASVDSVHDTLMGSTPHRANALGDFSHVGVGATRDASGRLWVTFNFVKVRQSRVQLAISE
jgi:uncharacterized protein YkwD